MVRYVSKHRHKENLRTSGTVLEQLEVFWYRVNAFQAFWDRMGAFGSLGRLGSIIPYIYVRNISKHRHDSILGVFGNVWGELGMG